MKVSTLAVLAGAALAVTACGGGRAMQDRTAPIRALLSADALMLVSFDTNADLIVTREEAEAGYGREWTRADADNNASLSPIEFSNWVEPGDGRFADRTVSPGFRPQRRQCDHARGIRH
jgi:hypothetical protein